MQSGETWMELHALHRHGWTISALAREFGLSRITVRRELASTGPRRYAGRALRSALNEAQQAHVARRIEVCPAIRGTIMYAELREGYGYTASYPAFIRHLRQLHPPLIKDPEIRFETAPGQQTQADWAHVGVWPLHDTRAELFAMVAILAFMAIFFDRLSKVTGPGGIGFELASPAAQEAAKAVAKRAKERIRAATRSAVAQRLPINRWTPEMLTVNFAQSPDAHTPVEVDSALEPTMEKTARATLLTARYGQQLLRLAGQPDTCDLKAWPGASPMNETSRTCCKGTSPRPHGIGWPDKALSEVGIPG